jgi:hypothetical protein
MGLLRPAGASLGGCCLFRDLSNKEGSNPSEWIAPSAYRLPDAANSGKSEAYAGLMPRTLDPAKRFEFTRPSGYLALRTLTHATSTRARAYDVRHIMFGTLLHEYLNVANNLFASSWDNLRPIISFGTRHWR